MQSSAGPCSCWLEDWDKIFKNRVIISSRELTQVEKRTVKLVCPALLLETLTAREYCLHTVMHGYSWFVSQERLGTFVRLQA